MEDHDWGNLRAWASGKTREGENGVGEKPEKDTGGIVDRPPKKGR